MADTPSQFPGSSMPPMSSLMSSSKVSSALFTPMDFNERAQVRVFVSCFVYAIFGIQPCCFRIPYAVRYRYVLYCSMLLVSRNLLRCVALCSWLMLLCFIDLESGVVMSCLRKHCFSPMLPATSFAPSSTESWFCHVSFTRSFLHPSDLVLAVLCPSSI